MKLSEQIDKLEGDYEELHFLCGMILSTLQVNRSSGSINTEDNIAFDNLIKSWRERYRKLNGPY